MNNSIPIIALLISMAAYAMAGYGGTGGGDVYISAPDNLGNHVAEKALDMDTFPIVDAGSITAGNIGMTTPAQAPGVATLRVSSQDASVNLELRANGALILAGSATVAGGVGVGQALTVTGTQTNASSITATNLRLNTPAQAPGVSALLVSSQDASVNLELQANGALILTGSATVAGGVGVGQALSVTGTTTLGSSATVATIGNGAVAMNVPGGIVTTSSITTPVAGNGTVALSVPGGITTTSSVTAPTIGNGTSAFTIPSPTTFVSSVTFKAMNTLAFSTSTTGTLASFVVVKSTGPVAIGSQGTLVITCGGTGFGSVLCGGDVALTWVADSSNTFTITNTGGAGVIFWQASVLP